MKLLSELLSHEQITGEWIKRMLDQEKFQVISFFPSVKVCRLSQEELGKLDPHGMSFFNINTPADMDRARQLLEEFGDVADLETG